jgi:hypothetical protein
MTLLTLARSTVSVGRYNIAYGVSHAYRQVNVASLRLGRTAVYCGRAGLRQRAAGRTVTGNGAR